MAIIAEINNDLTILKNFIESCNFLRDETCSILEDVERIDDSSHTCTRFEIRNSDDALLFAVEHFTGSYEAGSHKVYAFISDGSYKSRKLGTSNYGIESGIGCSNGFLLSSLSSHNFPIRITRNNLGKLVIVTAFSDTTNYEGYWRGQHCITFDDILPFRTIDLNHSERMQVVIAPMFTNSAYDTLSYTEKSGWMPYNKDYTPNLRTMVVNGHRYITDGLFAIEDDG